MDATVADAGGLWDAHEKIVVADTPDNTDAAPAFELQLTEYLKQPRVQRATNIYGYWNCSQFPQLEMAAQKYLSAPPTSTPSEQLFSSAGQIYADRRSNLLGENAEKLLFLAYNIRLFQFN